VLDKRRLEVPGPPIFRTELVFEKRPRNGRAPAQIAHSVRQPNVNIQLEWGSGKSSERSQVDWDWMFNQFGKK
jgi:hypothetical protein